MITGIGDSRGAEERENPELGAYGTMLLLAVASKGVAEVKLAEKLLGMMGPGCFRLGRGPRIVAAATC